MSTKVKQDKTHEQTARWYETPYPASAYTFPREALIHLVKFDDKYIHID